MTSAQWKSVERLLYRLHIAAVGAIAVEYLGHHSYGWWSVLFFVLGILVSAFGTERAKDRELMNRRNE